MLNIERKSNFNINEMDGNITIIWLLKGSLQGSQTTSRSSCAISVNSHDVIR